MSREVVSRLVLYLVPFFFLSTFSKTSALDLSDDCSKFDMAELEDYLSKLDLNNVPTVDMMIGEFKCSLTTLPFGALKSDWARLLLLQKAQPEGSMFKEKLPRLFRLLVVAYFRMEERFDVEQGLPATKKFSRFNASDTLSSTREFSTYEETMLTTESSTLDVNTNTTDTTIFTSHPKSVAGNVEDQQTITSTTFASDISIKTNDSKRDLQKTKGRGDFSMFPDFSNENTLSKEDDLKFITMQYHNVTNKNFVEFEKAESPKISDFEETTRENYDYSNRRHNIFHIFTNTSLLPSNKMKRPLISSKPSLNNDFWKHIVISRNVTLVPVTTLMPVAEDASDVNKNLMKSKKRGSLNSNIEKSFKWFYNLGQENSNVTVDRQGANIECSRRAGGK